MQVTIDKPTKIDIDAVRLTIPLRYLDEPKHIADDFPGRTGETLTLTIGMDDGIVRDWPAGRVESVYEKVCDEGTYALLGKDGAVVATREQNYVPDFFPDDHYGDYVILKIDGTGRVDKWSVSPRTFDEGNFRFVE